MGEINPRPWRYDAGEEEILSADGILVADMVEPGDGELIARACNSHDALLAACEDMLDAALDCNDPEWHKAWRDEIDAARAAIKLAKGESSP